MIEIRLVGCNMNCHVECVFCGDDMETDWGKTPVAVRDNERPGDVCEKCCAGGQVQRIQMRIDSLLEHIEELEEMAGEPIKGLEPGVLEHARFQSEVDYTFGLDAAL